MLQVLEVRLSNGYGVVFLANYMAVRMKLDLYRM